MADLFHKSAIDVVTGFAGIRAEMPAGIGIIGAGFVINRDLQQLRNGGNPSQRNSAGESSWKSNL